MIELIYNEEESCNTEEKILTEPKNIKQLGEPKEYKKIFMEDYVHTFLLQYSVEQELKIRIALLVGNAEHSSGKRHLYIKSALPVEGVVEKQGKYMFSEKMWGDLHLQCEKYFPDQEIMGWFFACPGLVVENAAVIEETHRTYFSGADKVLFMLEPLEGESGFFAFDGNRFRKQPGFYIYYEKNEPMHEFLMKKNSAQNDDRKKEKPDVAVANFRKILKEKQAKKIRRKKMAVSYGMKVTIALVLFVAVVTMKNQMEQIRTMEHQINQHVSDDVIVEVLSGDVDEQMSVVEEPVNEEIVEEVPVTEEVVEVVPNIEPEAEAENLTPEVLTPEISTSEVSEPEHYTVQAGDTLAKISRDRYGNDDMIDEICALNELGDGDYIQVGETILLP